MEHYMAMRGFGPYFSEDCVDAPAIAEIDDRCGLCRYAFILGDRLLVKRKAGRDPYPAVFDKWVLENRRRVTLEAIIPYPLPNVRAPQRTFKTSTFHEKCYLMCAPSLRDKIVDLMSCANRDAARTEGARRRFVQTQGAEVLVRLYGLPYDICELIISYCLEECTIAMAMAAAVKKESPRTIDVELCEDVWAKTVNFMGEEYIQHLTNEPADDYKRILKYDPEDVVRGVIVAENGLGIRDIRFHTAVSGVDTQDIPGVLWSGTRLTPDQVLTGKGNAVRLRSLLISDDPAAPAHYVPVSASLRGIGYADMPDPGGSPPTLGPLYPALRDRLWASLPDAGREFMVHTLVSRYDSALRTAFPFTVNDPTCTGYTVLRSSRYIYKIHAHTAAGGPGAYGTDGLDGYSTANAPSWNYFPMNPGETLAEIWTRKQTKRHEAAIVFKTSEGRVAFMGDMDESGTRCSATLIEHNPPAGTVMYFTGGQNCACEIAVPHRGEPLPDLTLPRVPRLFPGFTEFIKGQWTYTAARLERLVLVTPCFMVPGARHYDQRSVTGLILEYDDGKREAVGEVRVDRLLEPLYLQGRSTFYLGFDRISDAPVTVGLSPPAKGIVPMEINTSGVLEWWHNVSRCRIQYNGALSPGSADNS